MRGDFLYVQISFRCYGDCDGWTEGGAGQAILSNAVRVDTTGARPEATKRKLTFVAPVRVQPAQVGEPYEHAFCRPGPARGRLCGNPLRATTTTPTGGVAPYTFRLKIGGGFLPKGLVLNTSTGWVRGTPEPGTDRHGSAGRRAGNYVVTVCAFDSAGASVCARPTTIFVKPPARAAAAPAARESEPSFAGTWRGTWTATFGAERRCDPIRLSGPIIMHVLKRKVGYTIIMRLGQAGIKRNASTCEVVRRTDVNATERVERAGEHQLQSDHFAFTLTSAKEARGVLSDSVAGGTFHVKRV